MARPSPYVLVCLVLSLSAGAASAQQTGRNRPFEIMDNSFLIEEAFNQEPGIFQNILLGEVAGDAWAIGFTQEWPYRSQRHQLSYTLSVEGGDARGTNRGPILLNYRFQLLTEDERRPAVSPRLSLVIPGNQEDDIGLGLQANLPVSRQVGDLYLHGNVGFTYHPDVEEPTGIDPRGPVGDFESLLNPFLGASAIWRVRPMVNLMLETLIEFDEQQPGISTGGTLTTWRLSPGIRFGRNIGDSQLVLGAAVPLGLTADAEDVGFLAYFSYELPFRR